MKIEISKSAVFTGCRPETTACRACSTVSPVWLSCCCWWTIEIACCYISSTQKLGTQSSMNNPCFETLCIHIHQIHLVSPHNSTVSQSNFCNNFAFDIFYEILKLINFTCKQWVSGKCHHELNDLIFMIDWWWLSIIKIGFSLNIISCVTKTCHIERIWFNDRLYIWIVSWLGVSLNYWRRMTFKICIKQQCWIMWKLTTFPIKHQLRLRCCRSWQATDYWIRLLWIFQQNIICFVS